MIDTGLPGNVAIVTGANHGTGAATARALAAEGVAVLINYLRVPAPAEDIADVIVFLASHQGRWISAQTISVSGGRRLF